MGNPDKGFVGRTVKSAITVLSVAVVIAASSTIAHAKKTEASNKDSDNGVPLYTVLADGESGGKYKQKKRGANINPQNLSVSRDFKFYNQVASLDLTDPVQAETFLKFMDIRLAEKKLNEEVLLVGNNEPETKAQEVMVPVDQTVVTTEQQRALKPEAKNKTAVVRQMPVRTAISKESKSQESAKIVKPTKLDKGREQKGPRSGSLQKENSKVSEAKSAVDKEKDQARLARVSEARLAREQDRKKAEEQRLAREAKEKAKAEELRLAEGQRRAKRKAKAEELRLAKENRKVEEKAKAEALRVAEEKQKVEEKAKAEALRVAEEKRKAEEKAEAEALSVAEEKPKAEEKNREEKAKAEELKLAEEKHKAEEKNQAEKAQVEKKKRGNVEALAQEKKRKEEDRERIRQEREKEGLLAENKKHDAVLAQQEAEKAKPPKQAAFNILPGRPVAYQIAAEQDPGIINFDQAITRRFKVSGSYLDKGEHGNNIVKDHRGREFMNVMAFWDVLVEHRDNGENYYYGSIQFPLGSRHPAIVKSTVTGDEIALGCKAGEVLVLKGFETEGIDYTHGLVDAYLAHSTVMPDGTIAFQEVVRQPSFSLVNADTGCMPSDIFSRNHVDPERMGHDKTLDALPVREE